MKNLLHSIFKSRYWIFSILVFLAINISLCSKRNEVTRLKEEITKLKEVNEDTFEEKERLLDLQKQLKKDNIGLTEEVKILTDKQFTSGKVRVETNTVYKFNNKLNAQLTNTIDSLKTQNTLQKIAAISEVVDCESRVDLYRNLLDSTLVNTLPIPLYSKFSDEYNQFNIFTTKDSTILEGTIKNDLSISHYTKKEKKRGRVTYVNVVNNNPFVIDEKVVSYKIEKPKRKCFIFDLFR